MKKLIVGALLLALFGIPSVARAGMTREAPAVVAEAPAGRPTEPARVDDPPGTARDDYATREAAAPELGKFKGGGASIYIGGSALTVVLLVVLIVILI